MKRFIGAAAVLASLVSFPAFAEVDKKISQTIKASLQEARSDIEYGDVQASPIEGMYSIEILGGPVLYTTAKGDYFIAGDLFKVAPGEFVNLEEEKRSRARVTTLKALNPKEQITFAPKGEVKGDIYVFTDIDCGYCRKLHDEVPQLNEMGISVHYLAYPRAGVTSKSGDKIVTAFCADNPQETLTKLKNRETVPMNVCEDNPVAKQYELGSAMGVRGTPAIFLSDGTMLPGYMPAAELAAKMGL